MATSKQRQELAKQRKKEEKKLAEKQTTIVRHYTKPHWIEKILSDGLIDLEGCNVIPHQPNYESLILQYKLVGRYVWFTETTADSVISQLSYAGFSSADLPFFEFSAASLDIERWQDVRKTLTGNALLFARGMDDQARLSGDNPNNWWVSKRPVKVDKAIRVLHGSAASDNLVNPYELLSKQQS
jgi:hypothetical protein